MIVFQVTGDEPAKDDGLAMVKFAFPYFQQQTIDTSIRNGFLTSKKFKDDFNQTFFRVFQPSQGTDSGQSAQTPQPGTETGNSSGTQAPAEGSSK